MRKQYGPRPEGGFIWAPIDEEESALLNERVFHKVFGMWMGSLE